jgi:multidrug efflux pump subunit AcrA (membrane-fusion protein)
VVTERLVEPGDLAVNRAHLFTVVHIKKLRVRARVSELDLTRLREGQPALIKLDAYRERDFRGKLTKIYPQVDPRSRQVVAEVELPNPDLLLRPGLLARVRFEPILGRKAINLPAQSVVWDGNTERKRGHVFVIERIVRRKGGPAAKNGRGRREKGGGGAPRLNAGGGTAEANEKDGRRRRRGRKKGPKFRAKKREVRLGEMVDGRIEILEGLKAGEKVIVSATGQLKDGKPIRIVH